MPATAEITAQQRLAVVKHLASGKPLDVVATIAHLDRSVVLDIGSSHGYPDTDKLGWAADVLAKKIDDEQKATITPAPERRTQTPVAATSTPAATGPPPLTKPDEIRVLLNTAKAHPSKRIQNAADRVFDSLDKVRALIREDEEKHAEKRKAAAAKAEARAEVERLEEQLREAKAKLRGKPAAAPKRNTAPKGEHPCRNDGCDRVFDTGQGRSLHERMKCEHRAEQAS